MQVKLHEFMAPLLWRMSMEDLLIAKGCNVFLITEKY